MKRLARTKIVATVGPACRSSDLLRSLIRCGVDVFRLNTAHGTRDEHQATLNDIRAAAHAEGRPVGVLVDLAGPKIRLGQLHTDPIQCERDQLIRFVRGSVSQSPRDFTCTYEPLVDELREGNRILLADGTVSLVVVKKEPAAVHCRVTGPGLLRSKQGINLPGAVLGVPAMTDADLANATWAAQAGADFVSLSFVRSPQEVLELKSLLHNAGSAALVIAKIEKGEAVAQLEDIVLAADGIMVARGDLGVEIDIAETPVVQKRIVALCRRLTKPVIVATQMLDSMQHSSYPTRAEVSDVANAILDGADACMLSGETAIGSYPRESVEMMRRVMDATEADLQAPAEEHLPIPSLSGVHRITAASVYGASEVAHRLRAALVVICTRSGQTARVYAKFHCSTPTLGISDSPQTLQRLSLYWGITPVEFHSLADGPALREFVNRWGRERGLLKPGDCVVYLTGSEVYERAHNVLAVQEVT